jgi:hypothetical protein
VQPTTIVIEKPVLTIKLEDGKTFSVELPPWVPFVGFLSALFFLACVIAAIFYIGITISDRSPQRRPSLVEAVPCAESPRSPATSPTPSLPTP